MKSLFTDEELEELREAEEEFNQQDWDKIFEDMNNSFKTDPFFNMSQEDWDKCFEDMK